MSAHGSCRHPWHLVRCDGCRKFVISSAPRCPNCGTWRSSARAISFAVPVLAVVAIAAVFTFLIQTAIHVEKIRAEERAVLLQNAKQPIQ